MIRVEYWTPEQLEAALRKTYGKRADVMKQVIEVMKEIDPPKAAS